MHSHGCAMPYFDKCPEHVDLDITEETVSKMARKLKGAAGVGGTDSETIASWLLKFGTYQCNCTIDKVAVK